MKIYQIKANNVCIAPAYIRGYEQHGLAYFTWTDSPVVGAQCARCHTILWTDARKDPVLSERKPYGVSDWGDEYRRYYDDNLKRFLDNLPPCPHCGSLRYDRFVNNVQWPRFQDGTDIPGNISGTQMIPESPDTSLVWMCKW